MQTLGPESETRRAERVRSSGIGSALFAPQGRCRHLTDWRSRRKTAAGRRFIHGTKTVVGLPVTNLVIT
jgi:hypothetical protein